MNRFAMDGNKTILKQGKIIFLSSKNPLSKSNWSGIPFFMYQSLNEHFDIEVMQGPEFKFIRRLGYYASKLLLKLFGKKYVFDYGFVISLLYGIYYSFRLMPKQNIRFIFCPAGLTELAFIQTKIPIVSAGDCSTLQLLNYYPSLTNVFTVSKKEIEWVEKKALAKVRLQLFSSSWASDFTRNHFAISNIVEVPFGANLTASDSMEPIIQQKKTIPFNLVFISVDWHRKGGDIVLEIFNSLIKQSIPIHLTIIGCKPPIQVDSDRLMIFEHIDKNNERGKSLLEEILRKSHLMLLPTRADCTPIVIAEAFSHGLPVLANKTGGIPSMVMDNINGYLFERNEAVYYVNKIIEIYRDPGMYNQLALGSLNASRTTYNWNSWVSSGINAINNTL
jgi:glycosyltransferase involved in cell wall biosynthesis